MKHHYLIALLAGALLPCAFAPLSFSLLAIVSLIGLLLVWSQATTGKQAFLLGLLYGIGYFGVGVSWVYISIHVYGYTHPLLAFAITALFILFLACFPAGHLFFLQKLKSRCQGTSFALLFASSWVCLEWLRSYIFTGFPWLLMGYSQFNSPLIGYAPLIGVYGLSLLVCLSAACGYLLLTVPPIRSKCGYSILLLTVWTTGYLLIPKAWTQQEASPHSVSLIQGNILPLDKFMMQDPMGTTWDIYGKLSLPYLRPNHLVIWPENSLPLPLPYSQPFIDHLDDVFKQSQTTLILGLPTQKPDDPEHFHNSIIALGQGSGAYHKRQLVPFGEYLPLETWLRGLINFFNIPMSNFKANKAPSTLQIPDVSVLPFICYEIAYSNLVKQQLKAHPSDLLITISEDGWFGSSWGPHQHLDIARMRALEAGRYLLRATSSGISAIITPSGSIQAISPQFQAYVLNSHFYAYTGTTPFLALPVNAIFYCSFLITLLLSINFYKVYAILSTKISILGNRRHIGNFK